MGQKQSQVESNTKCYAKMCDSFFYEPITTHRTEITYNGNFQNDNYYYINENNDPNFKEQQKTSCISPKFATRLVQTPYWGTCVLSQPKGNHPEPRIGQCCVYDQNTDSLIIAYGKNNNHYLSDIWSLNLSKNKFDWKLISNNIPYPRSYASSTLVGRKMLIFGGEYENKFSDDLISIDINTGKVTLYQVKGDTKPSSRISPAFFAFGNHLFLFGGDTERPDNYIYQLRNNSWHDKFKKQIEWHKSQRGEKKLNSIAYCLHKGNIYIFNGGKENQLMIFDPKTRNLEQIKCTGVEPSSNLKNASLISVDEFIFLIGGEHYSKYMNIFAFDIKKKWWFALNVRPDNETIMLNDGIINTFGHFMVPREHSSSIVYSCKQREIISVMGSKLIDPVPIFRLKISDALSFIHHRSDMLDILQRDSF